MRARRRSTVIGRRSLWAVQSWSEPTVRFNNPWMPRGSVDSRLNLVEQSGQPIFAPPD